MRFIASIFFTLLLITSQANALDPSGRIELTGAGVQAGSLSLEEIAKLPMVEQEVSYQTSKGEENGRYKGVLLWSILDAHGIKAGAGHNGQLQHTFVVEGSDGYRIAFSVGEIDPDFGNAPIAVAFERDGKATVPGEGYRLIVPGDKRGARYVKDIVKIEVN